LIFSRPIWDFAGQYDLSYIFCQAKPPISERWAHCFLHNAVIPSNGQYSGYCWKWR